MPALRALSRALHILAFTLVATSASAWGRGIDFSQRTPLVELELRELFKQRPLPMPEIEAAIAAVMKDPRKALKITLGTLTWRSQYVPGMKRARAIYLYALEQSKGHGATAHESLLMSVRRGNAASNGTEALAEQYLEPLARSANERLEQMVRDANGRPLTYAEVGAHAELVESHQALAHNFGEAVERAKARLKSSERGQRLSPAETRQRLVSRLKALASRLSDWHSGKEQKGEGAYRTAESRIPDDLIREIEEAELDLLVYEADAQYARSSVSGEARTAAARLVRLMDGALMLYQGFEAAHMGAQTGNGFFSALSFMMVIWGIAKSTDAVEDHFFGSQDATAPEARAEPRVFGGSTALRAAQRLKRAYAQSTAESFRARQREEFSASLEKELADLNPEARRTLQVMLGEFRRTGGEFTGVPPQPIEAPAPAPRVRIAADESVSEPLPPHKRKRIEIRREVYDEEFLPEEETAAPGGACLRQTLRMVRGR